jgi:hypothetical protein
VTRDPVRLSGPAYAMKITFTDLGQCAAVIVRKWE